MSANVAPSLTERVHIGLERGIGEMLRGKNDVGRRGKMFRSTRLEFGGSLVCGGKGKGKECAWVAPRFKLVLRHAVPSHVL